MTEYITDTRITFDEWAAGRRIIKHRSKPWPKYLLDIYRDRITAQPEDRDGNQLTAAACLYRHGSDADRELIKTNWTLINTYAAWKNHPIGEVQP